MLNAKTNVSTAYNIYITDYKFVLYMIKLLLKNRPVHVLVYRHAVFHGIEHIAGSIRYRRSHLSLIFFHDYWGDHFKFFIFFIRKIKGHP